MALVFLDVGGVLLPFGVMWGHLGPGRALDRLPALARLAVLGCEPRSHA